MTSPFSPVAATTASAWVNRLERRLSKLADTASKESIQALSKWIGFRRMHAKEFSTSLANAIADPTCLSKSDPTLAATINKEARQWLYLQIVHESIILDSGTSRWERLHEMREVFGEFCILEVAKRNCLDLATIKKLEVMVKQWDDLHVFGVPTLISMIKKQLAATPAPAPAPAPTPATATTEAASTSEPSRPKSPKPERSSSPKPTTKTKEASPPNKEASSTSGEKAEGIEQPKEEATSTPTAAKPDVAKAPAAAAATESSSATTAASSTPNKPKKNVVYDFESKGIPFGKVEGKEFLAPCKAIATLQIARDLRNDNAVQVSSLLKSLPEEIQKLCDEAHSQVQETNKAYEMKDNKARELSVKINEQLLDMDIADQLQNVRTFMEVVEKQRQARQRLIHLLVKSRCRFGANEAAETYYDLEKIQVELKKRKNTLLDAMALEGLDFEEEEEEQPTDSKGKKKMTKRELAPLTWYLNEKNAATTANEEEPPTKRAKVE